MCVLQVSMCWIPLRARWCVRLAVALHAANFAWRILVVLIWTAEGGFIFVMLLSCKWYVSAVSVCECTCRVHACVHAWAHVRVCMWQRYSVFRRFFPAGFYWLLVCDGISKSISLVLRSWRPYSNTHFLCSLFSLLWTARERCYIALEREISSHLSIHQCVRVCATMACWRWLYKAKAWLCCNIDMRIDDQYCTIAKVNNVFKHYSVSYGSILD